MLLLIAAAELRTNVLNGKIALIGGTICVLSMLAGYVGTRQLDLRHIEFQSQQQRHDRQIRSYPTYEYVSVLGMYVDKKPSQLSALATGASRAFGNTFKIHRQWYPQFSGPSMVSSLVAILIPLDMLTITSFLITLVALLFGIDAIRTERESGTWALISTTGVNRSTLFWGKWVGAAVSAIACQTLSFGAAVAAMALTLNVSLAGRDWTAITIIWLLGIGCGLCFVSLGMAIAAFSRDSHRALCYGLLVWLCIAVILPRSAPAIVDVLTSKRNLGHLEGAVELLRQEGRRRVIEHLHDLAVTENRELTFEVIFDATQREADAVSTRVHVLRKDYENDLMSYDRRVFDALSIFPSGAFVAATSEIAGTGVIAKKLLLDQVKQFRNSLLNTIQHVPDRNAPLRMESLPTWESSDGSLIERLKSAVFPSIVLLMWCLMMLFGAMVAFGRLQF